MTFEDVVLAFENSDFFSGVKVPGTELNAIFKWKNLASKKWTSENKTVFLNIFYTYFVNWKKITIHL